MRAEQPHRTIILSQNFRPLLKNGIFSKTSAPQKHLDHIPTKLYGGDAENVVEDGKQKSSIEPERAAVAQTAQIKIATNHKQLMEETPLFELFYRKAEFLPFLSHDLTRFSK